MDLSDNLHIYFSLSEDILFLFFLHLFFKTRNIVLEIIEKKSNLQKRVVLELKLCISYSDLQYLESCAKFHS